MARHYEGSALRWFELTREERAILMALGYEDKLVRDEDAGWMARARLT